MIGAGRDSSRLQQLAELGADATVQISDDLTTMHEQFAEASEGRLDIVIEPLWGCPGPSRHGSIQRQRPSGEHSQRHRMEASMSALPLRNKRIRLAGYSGAWTTPEQRTNAYLRLLELAKEEPIEIDVHELALGEVAEVWPTISSSAGKKYVVRPALG